MPPAVSEDFQIGRRVALIGMCASAVLATIFLLVAIVIRGFMSAVKFRVGRRIQSASLIADAWNDGVDILAAATALTAVALAMYDSDRFLAADHYGGFAVGVTVILTGVRVFRDASLDLMDTDARCEIEFAAKSGP